jgi:hypothetical protein
MTEQQQVLRGQEAAQVLDNEAFKLAMDSLRQSGIDAMLACPIRDNEGRLLLAQYVKVVDKFRSDLYSMIESGKFASRQIELDKLRNEPKARQFVRKVLG